MEGFGGRRSLPLVQVQLLAQALDHAAATWSRKVHREGSSRYKPKAILPFSCHGSPFSVAEVCSEQQEVQVQGTGPMHATERVT